MPFFAVLLLLISPLGAENGLPEKYILNYPTADQFCLPVDTYVDDVTQAIQKRGGRTIRHQLNGGYGLPVVMMVGDQHVLQLGADVAWYRVGAPVYAIADGVVRVSQGPLLPAAEKNHAIATTANAHQAISKSVEVKSQTPEAGDAPTTNGIEESVAEPNENAIESEIESHGTTTPPSQKGHGGQASARQPAVSGWGNIIAIEHRLPDGSYVTSIYGHLGSARRVAVGDIVHAGDMIGTVGKSGMENGGFKPHLHFGIRSGRMFEPERNLFTVMIQGKVGEIKLVSFDEENAELETPDNLPLPLDLTLANHKFTISTRDGKTWMSAAALNYIQPAEFAITGYGLSTEGWLNPTEFLSQMLAQFPQAPFGGAKREPVKAASNLRP